MKRFEEEKASMSEEKTQLEERLRKALEQQKESMVKTYHTLWDRVAKLFTFPRLLALRGAS